MEKITYARGVRLDKEVVFVDDGGRAVVFGQWDSLSWDGRR